MEKKKRIKTFLIILASLFIVGFSIAMALSPPSNEPLSTDSVTIERTQKVVEFTYDEAR